MTRAIASAPADLRVVGIVAALPAEVRCLVHPDPHVGESRDVNARVRLRVGGIGAAAARQAALALISDGVGALVSWGFAAGLDNTLAAGTVVISTRVLTTPHAAGAPDGPDAEEPISQAWAGRLAARLGSAIPVVRGAIICPDHVARMPDEKHTLSTSGAVAADMESAAVAATAIAAGVPWLAIRVVVDAVNAIVPASIASAIDSVGRVQLPLLIRGLIRHPWDLADLPALAIAYRRAMRTLDIVGRAADVGLLIPDGVADGAGASGHRR